MTTIEGLECCWMACYPAAGEIGEGIVVVKASECCWRACCTPLELTNPSAFPYCLAYLTTSSADPRCAALTALESAIISWLLLNKPKGESYLFDGSVNTRSCFLVATLLVPRIASIHISVCSTMTHKGPRIPHRQNGP